VMAVTECGEVKHAGVFYCKSEQVPVLVRLTQTMRPEMYPWPTSSATESVSRITIRRALAHKILHDPAGCCSLVFRKFASAQATHYTRVFAA